MTWCDQLRHSLSGPRHKENSVAVDADQAIEAGFSNRFLDIAMV